MPRGEKLFRVLASPMLHDFYGTLTIRFQSGKGTHVQTEIRRTWLSQDLPEETDQEGFQAAPSRCPWYA